MASAAPVDIYGSYGAPTPKQQQDISRVLFPKSQYAPNYDPSGNYYSDYRTYTDPNTGKVIPTSWGTKDAYGNYTASYTTPGYTSSYKGDQPVNGTVDPSSTLGQAVVSGGLNQASTGAAGSGSAASTVAGQGQPSSSTGTGAAVSTQTGQAASSQGTQSSQSASNVGAAEAGKNVGVTQQTGTSGQQTGQAQTQQANPWNLWTRGQALATNEATNPQDAIKAGQSAIKQQTGVSTLGNAILNGGNQAYNTAAANTREAEIQNNNRFVQDFQNLQNQYATSYSQMLQDMAKQSGGTMTYVPGATG